MIPTRRNPQYLDPQREMNRFKDVPLVIEEDERVSQWEAVDDLDAATIRLYREFTTPRRLSDGRWYFDTAELGALIGALNGRTVDHEL